MARLCDEDLKEKDETDDEQKDRDEPKAVTLIT